MTPTTTPPFLFFARTTNQGRGGPRGHQHAWGKNTDHQWEMFCGSTDREPSRKRFQTILPHSLCRKCSLILLVGRTAFMHHILQGGTTWVHPSPTAAMSASATLPSAANAPAPCAKQLPRNHARAA